jgi:NhaP-type Na+/H+ or K+/H+ antiporter
MSRMITTLISSVMMGAILINNFINAVEGEDVIENTPSYQPTSVPTVENPTLVAEELVIEESPELVIVFLFLTLAIGTVVTYLISRYHIISSLPYTVVIFIIGIIFGLVHEDPMSSIGQSITMWDGINPELILFLFLPALLFGEAMSLNIYHVKNAISASMLLAGPGAIFGTFVIGGIAYYCLPYGWSFNLCLLFGSILCATDPVAVVALLKKVGAPHKLTYLITGEALLNDGAALVLYNLISNLVKVDSAELTPGYVVIYFIKVLTISPLLGMACGSLAYFCLRLANRRMKEDDKTVQFSVTLCCAYLSFFFAEYSLGCSGVISCCTAAVVLAAFAPPVILRPETMHTVWAAIEWCGNTLIFMLAGLIIGDRVLKTVTPHHVAFLIFNYLAVVGVRMLMMMICLPLMSRMKQQYTFKECVFMTWGGLRGAVSMALALSLNHATAKGQTIISEEEANLVFFFVGGVAAITLLLNATTSAWMLDLLELKHDTEANLNATNTMLSYARMRLHNKAQHIVDEVNQLNPGYFDYSITKKYCSILREPPIDKVYGAEQGSITRGIGEGVEMSSPKKLDSLYGGMGEEPSEEVLGVSLLAEEADRDSEFYQSRSGQERKELLAGTREVFLEVVRVGYWHQIRSGKLPRKSYSAIILLNSIDEAMERDSVMAGLMDWQAIMDHISPFLKRQQEDHEDLHRDPSNYDTLSLHSRDSSIEFSPLHGSAYSGSSNDLLQISEMPAPEALFNSEVFSSSDEDYRPRSRSMTEKGMDLALEMSSNMMGSRSTGRPGSGGKDSRREQHRLMSSRQNSESIGTDDSPGPSPMASPSKPRLLSQASKKLVRSVGNTNTVRDSKGSFTVQSLNSFIQAHEYAQRKIVFYLGNQSATLDTAEQRIVVKESKELVQKARNRLSEVDPTLVTKNISKQSARWILHAQEDLIEELQEEGILTAEQAETLQEAVEADFSLLERDDWFKSTVLGKAVIRTRDCIIAKPR